MILDTKLKWGLVGVAGLLSGAALIAIVQREAAAGTKTGANVSIDTNNQYATGSLGSARNSSSNYEYIGCEVDAWPDTGITDGSCHARMSGSSPPTASCWTEDPNLIAQIRSMNGDSYIQFNWFPSGECAYIAVSNNSQYAPKTL